jgi:hypothetical protein
MSEMCVIRTTGQRTAILMMTTNNGSLMFKLGAFQADGAGPVVCLIIDDRWTHISREIHSINLRQSNDQILSFVLLNSVVIDASIKRQHAHISHGVEYHSIAMTRLPPQHLK